ncbi:MAG TPA: fibronectin type III domain-containing protein, partial [Bacteroidia bacterium]|nr:fibronectin type III domain-containing protein [Bacteroidia bacterium]
MKSLLALILLLSCIRLAAQTPQSVTVQVHATAQTAPPSITLHWPADANANSYNIYRKARTAVGWGSLLGSVPGTDTTFVDATAQVGEAWEYRITKSATGYNGNGYCFAGIARPAQDYFGKLILVVDTTHATALAPELSRLTEDLWGDGWQVVRLDVDRNDLVPDIKARIQNIWMADPAHTRSVFLLGHVPVPYSGNLNPDGHGDHQGAWPADVYYGEMNGNWTDQTVNNSSAARPQNRNTIGDGKFDNTTIPGDVELEVGRLDFANMPAFGVGEQALLRRYLEKDHDWRMKAFAVTDSGVVDDNFGYFGGEAFATSG